MNDLNDYAEVLIHRPEQFSRETLMARAERAAHAQANTLEALAWDLELYGQIQRLTTQAMLKGGGATQLYLPQAFQRASVDVDILTDLPLERFVDEVIRPLEQRLALPGSRIFQFEHHQPPADQDPLPMVRYDVSVPTHFPDRGTDIRWIALEIMRQEHVLPSRTLKAPPCTALDLAYDPVCLSPGSLVGDKLLTLAIGSIGLREIKLTDLPKQLYDLDHLWRLLLKEEDWEHAYEAASMLIPVEARFRKFQDLTPARVFQDIDLLLSRFDGERQDQRCVVPGNLRTDWQSLVHGFQATYLPRSSFLSNPRWQLRAKRLQFLARMIERRLLEGTPNDPGLLRQAEEIALELGNWPVDRQKALRQALKQEYARVHNTAAPKSANGWPLDTLFWFTARPDNLEALREIIKEVRKPPAAPAESRPRPASGTILGTFKVGGGPRAIAFDPHGNAWVANQKTDNITKLSPDGAELGTFRAGHSPTGIAVDLEGNVWVVNGGQPVSRPPSVMKFANDGQLLGTFNLESVLSASDTLWGITLDHVGNAWVAVVTAGSVATLAPDGVVLGYHNVGASYPRNLAVDASGKVWVANETSHNVTQLSPDGQRLAITTVGNSPWAIAIDESGHLWVTNGGSHNITKLSATGQVLATFEVGKNPTGIAIDNTGHIWVANEASNSVSKLLPDGTVRTDFRIGAKPVDVSRDPAGNMWVTNFDDDTVVKIAS